MVNINERNHKWPDKKENKSEFGVKEYVFKIENYCCIVELYERGEKSGDDVIFQWDKNLLSLIM